MVWELQFPYGLQTTYPIKYYFCCVRGALILRAEIIPIEPDAGNAAEGN